MNRILTTLVMLNLWVVFAGCGQTEYTGAERFPLSGKVTYGGQPIDLGTISFLPLSGNAQRVSGGMIENGVFSVPEKHGANAGKYRVEIRWQKATGKKVKVMGSAEPIDERVEGLPAKFNSQSQLTADVPSPDNTYDFDLKP